MLFKATILYLVISLPSVMGASGDYSYDPNAEFGPQNWGNVVIEGAENQCNGNSNSPISLPSMECTANDAPYTLNSGTCTWEDMTYTISATGITASYPADDSTCQRPTMVMPSVTGKTGTYTAAQFHIHTSSEHDDNGELHPAEIHIVHFNDAGTEAAVLGSWIEMGHGLEDNEAFSPIITGFQDAYLTSSLCEQCSYGNAYSADQSSVADIYALYNKGAFYHYDGGLTTPPCTEIVAWNFSPTPISVSVEQYLNIATMLLTHKDENCALDTVAYEGSISRPVVPLGDRKLHYLCNINPCEGKTPSGFDNTDCKDADGNVVAVEQAGANVTKGYKGTREAIGQPITVPYSETNLCPVNVHWHLGTEHYSFGQYDENGKGPHSSRKLAGDVRMGYQCGLYNASDAKFTTKYDWKHCVNMEVGETYEVHWPHSAAGACGTPWQYQTPFYNGVFCTDGVISIDPLNTYTTIGVQGQVYTVVNDEAYYHDNLISGMVVDGQMGSDMAYYTGSTTGTSRNNQVCSNWAPITWQVDRKCHLISASSFDKLCEDMKKQRNDMSDDLYPHGSRELVADELAANNQV